MNKFFIKSIFSAVPDITINGIFLSIWYNKSTANVDLPLPGWPIITTTGALLSFLFLSKIYRIKSTNF